MSVSDNSDEEKIPKSPFAVYRTEADALFRSAKYPKAIKCYTQALELQPGHQHCLVARSRCYLFEGQIEKALADADASLANDSKNPKGLFQKAEVYYFQSEFEKALVLYHRGHKLRPEMEAFRLGIQKSEEAINNSVGNPDTIKLRLDCDLSYFFLNDETKTKKKKNENVLKKKQIQEKKKKLERKPYNTDPKTIKQLLGKLYSDREFLEKLLNEEENLVNKTENSEQIRTLVLKGLNYLDERSDFWQQQKPMYARKKFQPKRSKCSSMTGTKQQKDIISYVISTLDEIDNKQSKGEHKKSIKQAEYLIKQIDKWTENDLPDRWDILANLYCLIGNSYLDLEDYVNALMYHELDRNMGKKHDIEESISRSIDNIGRVYAKQKQYNEAIRIWQEKVPMSKSTLESTWLHHEMGRCYLELGDYENAIDYGEKSIEFAREAEDDTWQMNASILVAQAALKFKKYTLSIEYFNRALDYSKMMKNYNAEEAIKKAIEDVNKKLINEDNDKESKGASNKHLHKEEIKEESSRKEVTSESDNQKSEKAVDGKKDETEVDENTERESSPIKEEVVNVSNSSKTTEKDRSNEYNVIITERLEDQSEDETTAQEYTVNTKESKTDHHMSKVEESYTVNETVTEETVDIETTKIENKDEQRNVTPLEDITIE